MTWMNAVNSVSLTTDRRLLELRAAARLQLQARQLQQRYRDDPWFWLTNCAWTEDPHDHAFKPFPGNEDYGKYLAHDVALYLDDEARVVLGPKGRRDFLYRIGHAAPRS